MPKIVEFQELGTVEFPDEMSAEDISRVAPQVRQDLISNRERQVNEQTLAEETARHPNLTARFFATGFAPQLANTPLGLSQDEIGSAAATTIGALKRAVGSVPKFFGRIAETLPAEATMLGRFDYASPTARKVTRQIEEARAQETPQQRIERIEASPFVEVGRKVERIGSETAVPNPALERTFLLGDVPAGVGSLAGALAAAPTGPAGVYAATFGQEANDAWEQEMERQRREGESPNPDKALVKSALYGSIATAIEARLGVGRVYNRIKDFLKRAPADELKDALRNSANPLWTTVKGILKESASGFTEEALQQVAEDWIVEGRANLRNALRAGAAGAVVQGPTALITAAGDTMARRTPQEVVARELADVLNAPAATPPAPAPSGTGIPTPPIGPAPVGEAGAGVSGASEPPRPRFPFGPPPPPAPPRLPGRPVEPPPTPPAPSPTSPVSPETPVSGPRRTRMLGGPPTEPRPPRLPGRPLTEEAPKPPFSARPPEPPIPPRLPGRPITPTETKPQTSAEPPEVKPGYIRLWRGETEGQNGQWFSDDRETAELHFDSNGFNRPATLSYIDVPEDDAFNYGEAAFNHPDVKSGKTIADGGDHVLPPDLAKKAVVISRTTPEAPTNAQPPPPPAPLPPTEADVPGTTPPGPQAPGPVPSPPVGGPTPEAQAKIEAIRKRREEIAKKIRGKIGQTSSGVDPELALYAAELAVTYVEEGVVRFADFVRRVKADLPDIWSGVKSYLHGAWTTAGTVNPEVDEVGRKEAAEVIAREDSGTATPPEPPPSAPPAPPAPPPPGAVPNEKQAQEEQEAQLVREAADIAGGEGTPVEKFRNLVTLYNQSPRLNIRTAESKSQQAYSTPPPLAYLAGQLSDLNGGREILEPTAGNGMLLIDANENAGVRANELNADRRARLERFGRYAFRVPPRITGLDANSQEFYDLISKAFIDRVIANPPFGSVLDEEGKGTQFPIHGAITAKKTTPSVDLAIMLNSLNALTPDGRAVIIIGSKTGSMGATFGSPESRANAYRRQEFLDLFKRFNVTDWFTVDGKLYSRMGAAWPVDVIVINGKGETAHPDAGGTQRPWIVPPRVYTSWEQLEELIAGKPSAKPEGRPPVGPGVGGGEGGAGGGGGTGGQRPGGPRPVGGRPQPGSAPKPTGTPAPTPAEGGGGGTGGGEPTGVLPGGGAVAGTPGTQPGNAPGGGGLEITGGPGAGNAGADFTEGRLNVPFAPVSGNKDPKLVVPTVLADAMRQAILDLQKEAGKHIDDYTAEKLGWTREQLYERLSAAQIEEVGLAIRNIERGSSLINGNSTGVGKGRTAGSVLMDYARRVGKIPVFITATKELYEDMAGRDMPAVGHPHIKPFITDTDYEYTKADGEKVRSRGTKKEELEQIARTGKLPAGYDALFTTYNQLQNDVPSGFTETKQARARRKRNRQSKPDGPRYAALRAIAPNAIFVLDEAHRAAGGESDLNIKLADEILPRAAGTYLLTATFAKRADNLGIYAATTLMRRLGMRASALAELVQRGGNALYQALSHALTRSGEFVRKEQDFAGVTIEFKRAVENAEQEAENSDTYAGYLSDIERLARQVNAAAESETDDVNQTRPEEAQVDFEKANFAGRIFNLSQQYLLALRVPAVIREAIDVLKSPALDKDGKPILDENGKPLRQKPFISLYNTMEGPIDDLRARKLPVSFNGILLREMQKLLTVKIRDPAFIHPTDPSKNGRREHTFTPEELPDGGAFYRQLEKQILSTDLSAFPISPIDTIRQGLEKAGYKIGEITGRKKRFDEDQGDEGEPKLTKREKKQRNTILRAFNDGDLDGLIVNGSGSTGVSAHTDPRFLDQRRRVMIVAQPQPDVNQMMQMLGRIMRFGQTSLPKYIFLSSSLAAERRFLTMLRSKLSGLNANTSADTESTVTGAGLAEDIFNEVGDEVFYRVMEANPDIAQDVGIPIAEPGEAPPDTDGYARKYSGRFPMLNNADQQRIWDEIDSEYQQEIKILDEMGENPLRAKPEDLRAKTLEESEYTTGSGNTEFDRPSKLQKVTVVVANKPYTHEQAIALAEQNERKARMAVNEWIRKNQQAEADRLQTAEQRGATADQLDQIRARFRTAREKVSTALNRLGTTVGFDPTGNGNAQLMGVPVDIRLKSGDVSDLGSASKQELILATNTARRTITVAISKTESEDAYFTEGDEAKFDESAETNTTRYVATGNILRAFQKAMEGRGEGARPRVAIFTRDDGSVETGVIMPPGWSPGGAETGRERIENRTQFIRAVQGRFPIGAGPVTITNNTISLPATNDWRQVWGSPDFKAAVPYAPQRGSNFVGELTWDQDKWVKLFDLILRVADHWEYLSREERQSLGSATQPARGVDPRAVEFVIEDYAPNAPVEVSNEEPPLSRGVPVKGRLNEDGSITIYAKALNDQTGAAAVLVEELGHLVARQPEYWRLYDRLAATITDQEKQAMQALGYSEDVAVEEAVMRKVVAAEQGRLQESTFVRLWNDLKEWITRFLREWGLVKNTDADLREMVRAALKVRTYPGQARQSIGTATPLEEPETSVVGTPANQQFRNRAQLEEQMNAAGLDPEQRERYREIGMAQSGLIADSHVQEIKGWQDADEVPKNLAARDLRPVLEYADMRAAGQEDVALAPSADGFTVINIPAGERSQAANAVLYTHENLRRLQTRLSNKAGEAGNELSKVWNEVQEAQNRGIPDVAASTIADDAIDAFNQQIAAELQTADRTLTEERRQQLLKIARSIQQMQDTHGHAIPALGAAMLNIAKNIPSGVLDGSMEVTELGGVVAKGTSGAVGGVAGLARWIKAQTTAGSPVASQEIVDWLTKPSETGHIPLSYGGETMSRLKRLKAILDDESAARETIRNVREWFDTNAGVTTGKERVSTREFARRYFKWRTAQKNAATLLADLSRTFRKLSDKVAGVELAQEKLGQIMDDPQYKAALQAASDELQSATDDTYGLISDGRIYYPKGPLSQEFNPFFVPDEHRTISFSPNPQSITQNARNTAAMANSIERWLAEGNGDPSERRAWEDNLNWIRAHAMLDATLQSNYAVVPPFMLDSRPFGIASRLLLKLGVAGPPQGLKSFLPGIALHEFTRAEHRFAQLATELDDLFRKPSIGWFALHNSIVEGAKSHGLGATGIGEYVKGRQTLSEDVYQHYIPEVLSEIISRNQSLGGIKLGRGDRLSNGWIITEEDMAAVRVMQAHMTEFYRILERNSKFIENKAEPLTIRDEAIGVLRNILSMTSLIRMRRSPSRHGVLFANAWQSAKKEDEGNSQIADDGTAFTPTDARMQFLNDNIRVLNDYWMTTNPEFVKSVAYRADAITEKAHRDRAAEQASGRGTNAGVPNRLFDTVDKYLDWIAQEHVDAAPEDSPVSFADERVKAQQALAREFDSYTQHFIEQNKAKRIENEADVEVRVANLPGGPLTRPRRQMVAPDFFYNYAVATRADYAYLRAKALLPALSQVSQKMEAMHNALKDELDRRREEVRIGGGKTQRKYSMSLRALGIAERMVSLELSALHDNVNQSVKSVYDNDMVAIAKRIEEQLSMGLLAAPSPTLNNIFSSFTGAVAVNLMAGRAARALRLPLNLVNYKKRVLRFLMTAGQGTRLSKFIQKHRRFFGPFTDTLIRSLIEEEMQLAEYRDRAGIGQTQNFRERLRAMKENPAMYGHDFGPSNLTNMEKAMNRVLSFLEGAVVPDWSPVGKGAPLPGLGAVRTWTQTIDQTTVPTLGRDFDAQLDRMKEAMLEAMAKRADGTTEVDNWNDPNRALTPFTPEELGLKSFKDLEWYRQFMRPAGSIEYLALRYYNAVKAAQQRDGREDGPDDLKVPFAKPEEYNSMLREFIRSSGNPVDSLNRMTRLRPSGFWSFVQQAFMRFQGWSSNFASTWNRVFLRHAKDPLKDNAQFFVVAALAIIVAALSAMFWHEEKAEVVKALTGKESSVPRATSVQVPSDLARYSIAALTPTILPYYGEAAARLLGMTSNRPLLDLTAAVPAANIVASGFDAVAKMVQSKDPILPFIDFLKRSFPVSQMAFHAATPVSPLLRGEEESTAAAAAVRSSLPAGMEREGFGGRGGTLTPMSAFVRRAIDYAYAGKPDAAQAQIDKAIEYQISRGRSPKEAQRIVQQSIASRVPTKRVVGRLPVESEEAQLLSRMTGGQQAAYGAAQGALDRLNALTGGRASLVRQGRRTRSLAGTGTRRGRRRGFGSSRRLGRGRSLLAASGSGTRRRRRELYV